ncbi:MAG: caspase family protein [Magnetococcales bacterium]|nr:caspase family protein [Magnetococcales bacterium]
MNAPIFKSCDIDAFIALLQSFPFRRRIDSVHLHHTWRPNHAIWIAATNKVEVIQGMWRYHTEEKGWRDIAQHVTIDPAGEIWICRNWNWPPASATGFNGNETAGPFMIEMIGDFDQGNDDFAGPQKTTACRVIAEVLKKFGLPAEAMRFHNQMTSHKSCPGNTIGYAALLSDVAKVMQQPPANLRGPTLPAPVPPAPALAGSKLMDLLLTAESPPGPDATLGEEWNEASRTSPRGHALLTNARDIPPLGRGGADGEDAPLGASQLAELRLHVVNLREGCFSRDGDFQSDVAQLREIVTNIGAQLNKGPVRLLLWAHGGLVNEKSALRWAWTSLHWWKANGVYPVFFVWETGIMETLIDHFTSAHGESRGFLGSIKRGVWKGVCRLAARPLWRDMKNAAEHAFQASGQADDPCRMGGGWYFLQLLHTMLTNHDQRAQLEIHAVGHSAGSIFHAHMLQAAANLGLPVLHTCQFLAPAISIHDFNRLIWNPAKLDVRHVAPAGFTIFTMDREHEESDSSCGLGVVNYGRSLLCMISDALEDNQKEPLLGLQKHLRGHEVATPASTATIHYSPTVRNAPLGSRSNVSKHGCFDNDPETMESVLWRILSASGTPFTGTVLPFPGRTTECDEGTRALHSPAYRGKTTQGGRRFAICIGIDRYPTSPLGGCVRDAMTWQATLQGMGFQATTLTDGQATRDGIRVVVERMIRASRPGDALVWHYSGHGTQIPDLNGDEKDHEDEAICPIDFDRQGVLLDDDIGALFGLLPDGVSLTCFFDCCHSGTISRMGRSLSGGLVVPAPAASTPRFISLTGAMLKRQRKLLGKGKKGAGSGRTEAGLGDGNLGKVVVFSACRSDEVALESNGQGDFTLRATRILQGGGDKFTNKALEKRIEAAFGPTPRQHPTLDCPEFLMTRTLFT